MKSLTLPDPSVNCSYGQISNDRRCGFGWSMFLILLTVSIVLTALYSSSARAEAETVKPDSKDLHVVVKPGDSLTSILLRELESADDWKLVASANKIVAPNNLLPGDVIVIPHRFVQKRNYARLALSLIHI